MRTFLIALAVPLAMGAAAAPAAAQTSFVGSLGRAFGGDVQSSGTSWGLALGGSGAHSIGSELELSKNPHLATAGGQDLNVYTLMASLLVSAPIPVVRPYGAFGYGFIRQRSDASSGGLLDVSNNDVGYNAGGGVTIRLGRSAGIRADLRHFKVRKADGLSFQRFMIGLVLGG